MKPSLESLISRVLLISSPLFVSLCSGGQCEGTMTRIPDSDGGYGTTVTDAGPGNNLAIEECRRRCNVNVVSCQSVILADGTAAVACVEPRECPGGRRPAGLEPISLLASRDREVANWFSRMAHLEAASVTAFEIIVDEPDALGAPVALIEAARRAAKDEVRHTRITRRLARKFGAAAPAPVVIAPRTEPRSLEQMAIENAVEGCVHETYGALLASWQAREAEDESVRAAMASIAPDETRHAELSWALDAWARTQLDEASYGRVTTSRRAAANALIAGLAFEPGSAMVRDAGLPSAAQASAMAREMSRALWS